MLKKILALTRSNVKAPPLKRDFNSYDHSLVLGETACRGAALMVELVSGEKVVGYICASLINRKEIEERHIARLRDH